MTGLGAGRNGRWARRVVLGALMLAAAAGAALAQAPVYEPAAGWPKPLPNGWKFGGIAGIAADRHGHIWVNHFVGQAGADTDVARVGRASKPLDQPSILEFDADGALLRAWGGPGPGYDWPVYPHGLFVDHKGFVWIGGNNQADGQVLKFTRDGKFVMQIGGPGKASSASDTTRLGRPADIYVDARTNELYVADGYGNRRIIVFDADTGRFKRMWGAYGKPPVDRRADALDNFYRSDPQDPNGPPPATFNSPIHCVEISKDRLVYVCDRTNDRVQVFRTDGRFVREFMFHKDGSAPARVTGVAFSSDPRQTYLFVAASDHKNVAVARRSDGAVVSTFGAPGGSGPDGIQLLHMIEADAQGNVYTGDAAKRVTKWIPARRPR